MGDNWFVRNDDGIKLQEFVQLIIKICPHKLHERVDLMNGAIRLFTETDINGDGKVEFKEFVAYVMNEVETDKHRRPREGPGSNDPRYLQEKNKREKLSEFNQFKYNAAVLDAGKHFKPIL